MLELKRRAWQKITEALGRQRPLCLGANKLFSPAGTRTEFAKGLAYSLTASTTKGVKRELGRICSILMLDNVVPAPFLGVPGRNCSTFAPESYSVLKTRLTPM